MSDMSNNKSYTEVVLEFTDRLDIVEQRILKKLDVIVSSNTDLKAELAKGSARFKAIDDKIDGPSGLTKRVETNTSDIKNVRNLNAFIALLGSTIAGIIGTQK